MPGYTAGHFCMGSKFENRNHDVIPSRDEGSAVAFAFVLLSQEQSPVPHPRRVSVFAAGVGWQFTQRPGFSNP
jgi:hypothetical protein